MTVTFTPGPHPTSQSRSASSSSIPRGNQFPRSHLQSAFTPPTPPRTRPPPNFTIHSGTATPATPMSSRLQPDLEDPERQPLIATQELNRPRVAYSIAIGVLVVVTFAVVLGLGAWRIGQGEGGGRWPGGPH